MKFSSSPPGLKSLEWVSFQTMVNSLNSSQRGVLEVANAVAFDVLATRTGVDALHGLVSAARVLTGARYVALVVAYLGGQYPGVAHPKGAHPGGAGWSKFIGVGVAPADEVLAALRGNEPPATLQTLDSLDGQPSLSSFLGLPIRRGDAVLGSFYLCDKEGDAPFSASDKIIIQALCAHAAVAIHHLEVLSQQRSLVCGLIAAQEEERRAVAYDLHDGLTQYVMASHAHLEAFQVAQKGGKLEKAARDWEQGMALLKEAVVESRRMVNGLRLLSLDDLGLAGSIEQLIGEEKTRAGWDNADFIHNIAGRRFAVPFETAVYRVAQEALTNARRHAGASRVQVTLLEAAPVDEAVTRLSLEVRDWGCGFRAQAGAERGRFGLHGIIERVHLMNGSYELHSAPGEGTTLCTSFPTMLFAPETFAPEMRAETETPQISSLGANS